jgi:hypothetical protein
MADMTEHSQNENTRDVLINRYLPDIDNEQKQRLVNSAVKGGEFTNESQIENWLRDRASFGMVMLDNTDYITALTQALKIAPNLAATDYGSSRQRDLGQLWTDVARGFLGEIGLCKFIKERFGFELVLDYSIGPVEDYLPSDIKQIRLPDGTIIKPNKRISFKATKFNGIWLDIPGAQIGRSDAFILVKVGVAREHFVSFLKWISFMKDKLLPRAVEIGVISQDEANELWDGLPNLQKTPCYICGFLNDKIISSPPPPLYKPQYTRQRVLKSYLMKSYVGWVKRKKPQSVPNDLIDKEWNFESIGEFSSEDHFVANAGNLFYSEKDWRNLLTNLTEVK